jgi:hypothetical protein
MATLKSKTLFFVTSPRTPFKMIPEIRLLVEEFTGQLWDNNTQLLFEKRLSETKMSMARDYADACFRYLRATEHVVSSKSGSYLKFEWFNKIKALTNDWVQIH